MTTPTGHRRIQEEQLARRARDTRLKLKRASKRRRRAAAHTGHEVDPLPKRIDSSTPAPVTPKDRGSVISRVKLRLAKLGVSDWMSQRGQDRCMFRRRDSVTGRIKRFENGQEVAPCGGKLKGKGPTAVCRRCGRTPMEVAAR